MSGLQHNQHHQTIVGEWFRTVEEVDRERFTTSILSVSDAHRNTWRVCITPVPLYLHRLLVSFINIDSWLKTHHRFTRDLFLPAYFECHLRSLLAVCFGYGTLLHNLDTKVWKRTSEWTPWCHNLDRAWRTAIHWAWICRCLKEIPVFNWQWQQSTVQV